MAGTDKPWSAARDGVRLRVRLIPKSSRDQIDGIEALGDGPVLKARVRAVPEDGKANAALAALVADWIGLAKGAVAVVAGQKSRLKTVAIQGNAADIGNRIEALVTQFRDGSGNDKRRGD